MYSEKIKKFYCSAIQRNMQFLTLGGILLVALLFRIGYACRDGIVPRDGVSYLKQASQWEQSEDFRTLKKYLPSPCDAAAPEYYPPPSYPFLLKTLKKILPFLSWETIAVAWGIFAGTAFVALVYWIAIMVFSSPKTAAAIALLAAIHPRCAESAPLVLRDATFLLFQTLVLGLALSAWLRRRVWIMAAAGFLLPTVFLCRFEGIAIVLFLLGALSAAAVVKRKRFYWGMWLADLGGMIAGVFCWTWLMSVPWEFYSIYFSRYLLIRYALP